MTAFGTGDAGGKTAVELYFPTDPGYRDTVSIKLVIVYIVFCAYCVC